MDPDFINNLNNMINSGKIPDNIKNMFNNLNNSSNASNNSNNINNSDNSNDSSNLGKSNNSNNINFDMFNNIDINMIMKMKSIMEKMNESKNDPRSNLLLSLKPYLKESRRNKIEQYIQLFNMSHIIEALNNNDGGGEKTK